MDVKYSTIMKSLVISLFLLSWIFSFQVRPIQASDEHNLVAGEIIAIGKVKMIVDGNQWVDLNSTSMPIFYESSIAVFDGRSTISLHNNGIVELSENTDIYLQRDEKYVSIKIKRGGLRFSFPPQSHILIETPTAIIGDKSSYMVAANRNIPIFLNDSEKAGEVLVKNDGLSLVNALKGNIIVTPLNSKHSTTVSPGELLQVAQLENVSLPTPIPSIDPKEGYFWGWVPEKGAWEQVKLGTVPPAQDILRKDLPELPDGYTWGWDEAQMRWVSLKVKDGDIVIKRMQIKDEAGNWYWKEITSSSPIPVETYKTAKAVKGGSSISMKHILGGVAVVGATAAVVVAASNEGTASPSN